MTLLELPTFCWNATANRILKNKLFLLQVSKQHDEIQEVSTILYLIHLK